MVDENDDYYREEPWRKPTVHRAMLSEKIAALEVALTIAMERIERAKELGCDVTDEGFYNIVHNAQRLGENWDE